MSKAKITRWPPGPVSPGPLPVRVGQLIFGYHDIERAARVPAVDIGRQFALPPSDGARVFGADARIEDPLRVARSARLVGMALGQRTAVGRVGEPDAAVGMRHEIVGRVERLAVIGVCNHGHRAVVLPADNAAEEILGRDLAPLKIE
jgi:hypothetical protein